jgi:sortase A
VHRKTALVIAFCAILALGFGLVSWAAVNIWMQSPSQITPEAEEPEPAEDTVQAEPVALNEGDMLGSLSIPSLDETVPIVEGTSEDDLKKGAGHYIQSVLPGDNDNCVISGHRDTFFANLGSLGIGDILVVQTSSGTFTYRISNIRIVDKDDRTVIVPTDHAVLTLTTCYPFLFIGDAPNRYIISSDLV